MSKKAKSRTDVKVNVQESNKHGVCLTAKDLNRILSHSEVDKRKVGDRFHTVDGDWNVDNKKHHTKLRKERMKAMDYERQQKEIMEQQNSIARESSTAASPSGGSAMGDDLIKLLNTYSQRAISFHIRDQQLLDKKDKLLKEQDYEKRMNLAMEVDRLKDVQCREQQEADKLKKRISDRKVIEEQMEERRQQKLLQEEEREQENVRMNEKIKQYEDHCAQVEARKKEESMKARQEVLLANQAALESRIEARRREKEEVEEILAYQAMQDEKLRRREEEEAEAAREKMEVQKRMLESQSKVLDKHHELDELRQRRASEAAERKARQKDIMDAKKRRDDMLEMNEFRRKQEKEKEEQSERDKLARQEEHANALRYAYQMAEREKEENRQREVKNAKFRDDIRKQISELEESKAKALQAKKIEGKRIKDQIMVERQNLEMIRSKMVNDLSKIGVNEKYFSEMLAMDIEKFHMR